MTETPAKLREIRNEIEKISEIMEHGTTLMNQYRRDFLFSEIDTLMNVLNLRECLIVLRTVLEKLLFFWLMLAGEKYRWTYTYTIYPIRSNTRKEARDTTFGFWQNLNKSGDKRFQYVTMLQKAKREDTIIVNYEYEGLYEEMDLQRTGTTIIFIEKICYGAKTLNRYDSTRPED